VKEVLQVLQQMRDIPYENLSKIVAFHKNPTPEQLLETPEALYRRATELGGGGTCFSLTYFLYRQLEEKGFSSRFLMADKIYPSSTTVHHNVHCGLLLSWEGQSYLLDPGYMIFDPLLIPSAGLSTHTTSIPNTICLEDALVEGTWRLHTGTLKNHEEESSLKYRFSFRKTPVDLETFSKHWKESFYYPMMEYPVLNFVQDGVQYYLQKNNLMTRTKGGSVMNKLSLEQFHQVTQDVFKLDQGVVEEALDVVLKKKPHLFQSLQSLH
jgi:arylamine N-acetyltransferase